MQSFSIIICTYNRSESLRTTLASLAQLSVPPDMSWELIVVDNNSSDDTAEVVKSFTAASGLCIRYIFQAQQGLSYARNAGINVASGEIVAFTDDDVTVDSRWLCELQKTFGEFDCMGVGGRIVPVWVGRRPSWLELDRPHPLRSDIHLCGPLVSFDHGEEPCELRVLPFGANMAFKKAAFERHGTFRTDLGRGSTLVLGEDKEFGARLLRSGDKLVYAPGAVVYHPVPEARLKKAHFESHYFNSGRYMTRVNGVPDNAILWFGVPRYLYRSLLLHTCRWLSTFDSPRRFSHKLQFCECLGEISEARRMSKDGRLRVGALQRLP
jgi:glycosyltransferase involved in cell wall biosynthesis